MNRYGQLAMDHWASERPTDLAQITDRAGFFTTLGLTVQMRVSELTRILYEEMPASEDYQTRTGQWNQARANAEERALEELVYQPTTLE
jgi:hypothetical protein